MAIPESLRHTPPAESLLSSKDWQKIVQKLRDDKQITLGFHPTLPEVITFRDVETDEVVVPFNDGKLAGIHGFFLPTHRNFVQESGRLAVLSKKLSEVTGIQTVRIELLTKPIMNQLKKAIKEPRKVDPDVVFSMDERIEQDIIDYFSGLFEGQQIELKSVDLRNRGIQLENEYRPVTSNLYVFTNRGQEDSTVIGLDMLGYDANGTVQPIDESPQMETGVYQNVGGFVTIPNAASLQERKDISRYAVNVLKEITHNVNLTVLTVDENLLNVWKENGQPWPSEQEIERFLEKPAKKRVDYGGVINGFEREVFVTLYEPNTSHIGGTQIKVIVKDAPDVYQSLLFEKGWIYNLVPAWSGQGRGPTYTEGILPFFQRGMLGTSFENLRLFSSPKLLQSISPAVLSLAHRQNETDKNNKYFQPELFNTLEVFHRFGEDYLDLYMRLHSNKFYNKLLRTNQISKIMKGLREREASAYNIKVVHHAVVLSHSHLDHSFGSAMIRDMIRRVWSIETWALLMSDFAGSHLNYFDGEAAMRKMRERPELKNRNAYATFAYPHYLIRPFERVELAPDVFVTAIPVDHSVPGSMGYYIEVLNSKKQVVNTIAYPGDYRNETFFDEVGKRGGADLLMIDGTNPPKVNTESVKFSEQDVKNNFEQLLQRAASEGEGTLVVVDLVKNAFARLNNFLQLTLQYNRIPVLSTRMAHALETVLEATKFFGGDNATLPNIAELGIKVWKKPAARYYPFEQQLFSNYGEITQDDLSESPEKFVLFRDATERPDKIGGIAADTVHWVQSTYDTYDEFSKAEKEFRRAFAEHKGWLFYEKGFHARGHETLLEADHPDAKDGILAHIPVAKAKSILPIHTEHRRIVSNAIKHYPGYEGILIYDRAQHPRHVIRLKSQLKKS